MLSAIRATAMASVLLLAGCSQDEFRAVLSSSSDGAVLAPVGDGSVGFAHAAAALADAGAPAHETTAPSAPTRPGMPVSRSPTDGGATGAAEGDAGGDDSATNVDASPARPRCTNGKAGPAMASITASNGASFCIDTTEVTVSDYAAFVASDPPLSLLPAAVCAWKKSFSPGADSAASGAPDLPVSSVDWCDAAAYCAYAGKHLCGKVGGGANVYGDFAKPSSEWYFACTAGGKATYPYGATFDPSACVGIDFDGTSGFQPASDTPRAAGVASRCHGQTAPFDAVGDLAGNVAEWEDSCDSSNGSADYCHVRGDSYREGNASTMACAYAPRLTRSYRAAYVGFRCCSEK